MISMESGIYGYKWHILHNDNRTLVSKLWKLWKFLHGNLNFHVTHPIRAFLFY